MLAMTLTLTVPLLVLQYVHLKNFCQNRTTNERLAGPRKYMKRSKASRERGDDSSGSMVSTTSSMLAVELVNDMGTPEDHSDKACSCFYNLFDMCCSRKMPN